MAQLERATSKYGKKYLSSGIVKYDEVEAKTIRVGGKNNANGTIEVLDNTNVQKVLVNKDGITLSNGAELINGNGILTNLQYKSSGVEPLGYRQISLEGIGLFFGFVGIQGFIPDNFTIREAYITVTVFKTLNEFVLPETLDTTSEYGKVTNIRLYKVASSVEYTNSTNFGLFGFDLPTGTEVTNAFATGGYTNATTDGITFTSIDIADELDEGTNDFFIATGDTLPDGGTNAGTTTAAQKSQIAIATLTIIGYAE